MDAASQRHRKAPQDDNLWSSHIVGVAGRECALGFASVPMHSLPGSACKEYILQCWRVLVTCKKDEKSFRGAASRGRLASAVGVASRRFAFYNGEASEIGGRRAASPSGTRCETELDSRAPSARSTRVFPPQNSTISVTRLQSVNNCVLPWEILRRPPHQCMCLLRAAFPNRRTACELQRITPTRATGATWSDFLASRRDQKPMHHNAHDDKT